MKNNLNIKNKSISKKSKKISKSINSSKTKLERSHNIKQIEFPQGQKFKCIGPCYPANMLYYHPLTLQAIKSKSNSCPIEQQKIGSKIKIKDKCEPIKDYNFDSYDLFADPIQIAINDEVFLSQIYNINNIYDLGLFLDNNIKQLPILSQKRILNSIYKTFRDDDLFPNNNFVKQVKKITKNIYDIDVKSKKIIKLIMENKHHKMWNDIFYEITNY